MSEVRFLATSWLAALVLVALCLSGCGSDNTALTGPGVLPLPQQQIGVLGSELATITSFDRVELPNTPVRLIWEVVNSPVSNYEIQICDPSQCTSYVKIECTEATSCRVKDGVTGNVRGNLSLSAKTDLYHLRFNFRDYLKMSLGGGSVSLKLRSYSVDGRVSVWFGDTRN